MRKEFQRDEGLARLSRGTRWLTAGALVSAGCLSVAVAETLPGRTSAIARLPASNGSTPAAGAPAGSRPGTVASSGAATPSDPAATPSDPAATPAGTQTLSPPTTAPRQVYNPPVVSSGGS